MTTRNLSKFANLGSWSTFPFIWPACCSTLLFFSAANGALYLVLCTLYMVHKCALYLVVQSLHALELLKNTLYLVNKCTLYMVHKCSLCLEHLKINLPEPDFALKLVNPLFSVKPTHMIATGTHYPVLDSIVIQC